MGISNVFNITGTALNAQSIHIDVIAKNMANAQVMSSNAQDAYRAKRPVFSSMLESSLGGSSSRNSISFNSSGGGSTTRGIKIEQLADSQTPIERQRMPGNPLADSDGYVYLSNVNMVEEMAFMMQASRAYQSNIEVMNTSKQLMLRTLSLGSR